MLAGFVHKRGRGKNTSQSLRRLGGESSPRLDSYLKLNLEDRGKNTSQSLRRLGGESFPRLDPYLKLNLEDWSLAAMTWEEA